MHHSAYDAVLKISSIIPQTASYLLKNEVHFKAYYICHQVLVIYSLQKTIFVAYHTIPKVETLEQGVRKRNF